MRSATSTLVLLTLASCSTESTVANLSSVSQSAGIRGAIFTTLEDGARVNHNIYEDKNDVYLDGGPSGGSPSNAASLAAGDYYFQVTDPSGKVLLSQDAIECRRIHVNEDGVIDAVVGGCAHDTGVDQDYASLGAITVQLMPYADTPNPGGEYKVWVTPVGDYTGSGRFHGFIPAQSKTDNFKVRETVVAPPPDDEEPPPPPDDGDCEHDCPPDDEEPPPPPPDDGECEHDCPPPPPPHDCVCGDGVVDAGEECDDGNTASGDGCSATCTTEGISYPPPPPEDEGDGDGSYTPPEGTLCTDCLLPVGTRNEYGTLY